MTIEELEATYRQLHERLLRDELDEASFRSHVDQLGFEDDRGNQWRIGWYTGRWYRYDQGKWIRGTPRPRQVATVGASERLTERQPKAPRSAARWLVPALIGLLALAAIALVFGGYARNGSDLVKVSGRPSAPASTPADTTRATDTVPGSPPTIAQATGQASPTAPAVPTTPATTTPLPAVTNSPTPTMAVEPAATGGQEPSPAPAIVPALAGQIFFPAYDRDGHTFHIYRFDLESGERTRIVEQASQPALSPNGSRLAYRSWNSQMLGLRVLELADGNDWSWINFAEAARPSWAPDSQNIVFSSQQEPDRDWRIYYTLGLEFDRVRRHGGDILGRVPTWLADGRIVYWECPQSQCGLWVMQSDGTSAVRLSTYEHDTAPAGSPDASQIAFMSDRDDNWEIYVADTHPRAGQEARRLTQSPARDGLPTWSPDGQWLAFASDREGPWAIWAVQPDGSGLQKLFDLDGSLEGEIAGVPPDDQAGWTWESIAWRQSGEE